MSHREFPINLARKKGFPTKTVGKKQGKDISQRISISCYWKFKKDFFYKIINHNIICSLLTDIIPLPLSAQLIQRSNACSCIHAKHSVETLVNQCRKTWSFMGLHWSYSITSWPLCCTWKVDAMWCTCQKAMLGLSEWDVTFLCKLCEVGKCLFTE